MQVTWIFFLEKRFIQCFRFLHYIRENNKFFDQKRENLNNKLFDQKREDNKFNIKRLKGTNTTWMK